MHEAIVIRPIFLEPIFNPSAGLIKRAAAQRLIQITQKGLFHRSVVDMRLNQIQMVNYQVAGLQETLLGFGTIMMQTFVGDLIIHDVHHPAVIQKKLLETLRDHGVAVDPYSQTEVQEQVAEEA